MLLVVALAVNALAVVALVVVASVVALVVVELVVAVAVADVAVMDVVHTHSRGTGGAEERFLKEEVRHGSWIISVCWRVSSPLCPVVLTERVLKEGRHAGHAHLFGKVVTQGKKGRSYIRGSITCARAQEAVCKEVSKRAV